MDCFARKSETGQPSCARTGPPTRVPQGFCKNLRRRSCRTRLDVIAAADEFVKYDDMQTRQPLDTFGADLRAGFAEKLVGEQSAAHADLATDAPDGQFNALVVKRFLSRKNILIEAIGERAVEIKQEHSLDAHRHSPFAGPATDANWAAPDRSPRPQPFRERHQRWCHIWQFGPTPSGAANWAEKH